MQKPHWRISIGHAARELDIHYPPHFLRMLARIWVEASISHYENISLKDKADIYNGVFIPEVKVSLEDILREATQKPILELEEGVKLGIPYDDMIKSPSKLLVVDQQIRVSGYGICIVFEVLTVIKGEYGISYVRAYIVHYQFVYVILYIIRLILI
jgi:hypothetical protein